MTTLGDYLTVANNLGRWQTITAANPTVKLETQYYKAHIGKVTSIDEFLHDTRLYNYAMTAFGLGDQASYYKGLIRKVLQQGVVGTSNLAHTLNDSRILALASTFNFAANGASTTQSSAVQTDTVNRFIDQSLDTAQGQQNPGVRLALYFQQNASTITSAYSVLANKNLLTVVQTALGLSPMMSAQPVDEQARQLSSMLKIQDFRDPKKVQSFIERFCAMYDINNSSALGTGFASMTPPANAILTRATGVVGLSTDLLLSIQSLKLGGY